MKHLLLQVQLHTDPSSINNKWQLFALVVIALVVTVNLILNFITKSKEIQSNKNIYEAIQTLQKDYKAQTTIIDIIFRRREGGGSNLNLEQMMLVYNWVYDLAAFKVISMLNAQWDNVIKTSEENIIDVITVGIKTLYQQDAIDIAHFSYNDVPLNRFIYQEGSNIILAKCVEHVSRGKKNNGFKRRIQDEFTSHCQRTIENAKNLKMVI
jgi:hypothetical protein